jgi:PAS domain S-box-containing protein
VRVNGKITGVLGIAIDVTERKREQKALMAAREYARNIIESSLDVIIAVDMDRNIVEFNRAAQRTFGYRPEEVLGRHVDILYADPRQGLEIHRTTVETGQCVREIRSRRKNGQVFPGFLSASVLRDAHGELIGVMGVSRDVTERVRREEALRLLSSAVEQSREGIAVADLEGHLMYANSAFAVAHGYTAEEIIGQPLSIFHTPEQLPAVEAANRQMRETSEFSGEIWHARRDGTVFPGLVHNSLLRDEAGEAVGMIGTLRDITDLKRTEEALRRRNRELALLNRAGQALVSTLDLDQVLATILDEVRRLLGAVATSVWLEDPATGELVCWQATGPRDEIVRGWRLAPGEGIAGWVARSGESLVVPDLRSDERHFEGVDQQTGLALRSILSVPLWVKNGVIGVIQVVDGTVDRFSTADLELMEPLSMAAAMAIENARLYEQARQDVEIKSGLLREVNHRVKNNLTAIIGLLYTARRQAEVRDRATYQVTMNDLVGRVRGLAAVHGMLSAAEWAPLQLSDLVTQVIHTALRALPHGKQVSVDVSPTSVHVTPDQAHHLALVVNELATNTVKYALQERDAAAITVRITLEDSTDAPMVRCEFRDDGPGYPPEVLRMERLNVGFDLVQNIVRDNLCGELALRNDRGAVAIVRFEVNGPQAPHDTDFPGSDGEAGA